MLSSVVPRVLEHVKTLLSKYNIDSVRIVGELCNKIQEHRMSDEVIGVLIDCEYLVDKIYELNATLPSSEHIPSEEVVEQCLAVRRLELHNWRLMLEYKLRRVEKSDILHFIHFYRILSQVGSIG
jgi:hypothetical protein